MEKASLEPFLFVGLTEEQAMVYQSLLSHTAMAASVISRTVGIERTLTYKILGQLIDLKLVKKHDQKGEVNTFSAEHPQRLTEIFEEKRLQLEQAGTRLAFEMGNIISTFNLSAGKPHVRFMEGYDGFKYINKDIISCGKDIKLIRSSIDSDDPEMLRLIEEQINMKVKKGIKTFIVGPWPTQIGPEATVVKKRDQERLVERRILDNFFVPTQVLVYNNRVAITDYKNNIITTVIENDSVQQTFQTIFDTLFAFGKTIDGYKQLHT